MNLILSVKIADNLETNECRSKPLHLITFHIFSFMSSIPDQFLKYIRSDDVSKLQTLIPQSEIDINERDEEGST